MFLFLDLNAYFASVEQQERRELRGRPTAVVATLTENTVCIAASYEAKARGIKTGTSVRDARRLCPPLHLVEARPSLYVDYHHRIIEAVERCLPVHAVHSVDEMSCILMSNEQDDRTAIGIALQIKQSIRRHAGDTLRCSIGIAPNRFLAKVGTNMQKPDGLVVIHASELPEKLYCLEPSDLPGVGRQMLRRLQRSGIQTMKQFCALTAKQMSEIWHSVEGERFWYCLHGYKLSDIPTHRRTVGHSHVLPPKWRTRYGAYTVFIRLIHKAAARMRDIGYWAKKLSIQVEILGDRRWSQWIHLGLCQDTLSILEGFYRLWPLCPPGKPYHISLVLFDLVPGTSATMPLYPGERNRMVLSHTMDRINAVFGKNAVYFGSMFGAEEAAPTRISFTHVPDYSRPF